ncbi:precorrin-2 dehydrogenase/sirohydrochlorin ferrochelatase family protein [Vibrio hippocampi]|uniref:precorrin-2 dehydrogenase n=1 Tax=Vibrio hippocampi TaxID=654686 RepID=A0ABM8ZHJ3_9VIBR|nr:bifunctional precorrin-2 dehydrogenase/sirohydrochlorin ferrochelatase [Vibrio hippocampi]CAH0525923.1 Siroheme synthase [Vibrio hippocampi]
MRYFPLFMDLQNKPVLVVGGGEVACRKVDSLLRAGAKVTIVSPKVESYLQTQIESGKCHWIQRFYEPSMLTRDYLQVWATTDNPALNHKVHKNAKEVGVLVNVVDDTPYCDFITPSIINRGRIQLAISSGGASPVLIRGIREKIESVLPMNTAQLADFAASKREDIKSHYATVDERRKFWERFFQTPAVLSSSNNQQLQQLYQGLIQQNVPFVDSCTWIEYGEDPELLPIKALRLMQEAEIVYHDKNCPFSFIDLVRRDAERIAYDQLTNVAGEISASKSQQQRVVVFISPNSSAYLLIKEGDQVIELAKIK